MKTLFGVDIGGTQIKIGSFSEKGVLLDKWAVDTDLSEQGSRIIPTVAREIRNYASEHQIPVEEIAGIGMGIPGPVDGNGYVKVCVNLNWRDFNPVTEIQKEFPGVSAAAENDANLAALGEYYCGAGKEASSMMLVTLGTGVGGGIIIGGNIISGFHGIAGEIGHITPHIEEHEKCNCGNVGCVDQFASATGMVRIMKKLLESGEVESTLHYNQEISAKDICQCAAKGDPGAKKCLEICMGALGEGLSIFSHAFDPEIYVIGGGVSKAGQIIIDAIEKEYEKHFFLIEKGAKITLASLGNDAGIIGGSILAAKQAGLS